MRKLLLFALLAALSVPSHADPPQRSVAPSFKNLLAPQERSAWQPRSAKTPALRAAEAPANAVEVPFTHAVGKSQSDIYPKFDRNGDGKGWSHMTGYAACTGPAAAKAEVNDDWIISPPVHLYAGKSYTASFGEGVNTPNGTKTGVLALYMGSEQLPEAMGTELVAPHPITEKYNTNTGLPCKEAEFTVDADGYYYFGFHSTTTLEKTAITTLYNFSIIESGTKVIPPAAGELSYELAPKGELKASVRYVAPKKDIEGNDLEAITKVEIKTNWVVSHTFENVTPGQTIDFETELLHSPYNIIEAIAYIEDTPGESAKVKDFYAGLDNPMPVQNVVASLADDFKHVTLSWEPVGEVGESGGYVDTENVVYYIFDAFGSYYDPAIAQTDKTEITLDFSDVDGQDFVAFQVTAGVDETYYSLGTNSNIVTVGTPDLLPWHESFSNGYYSQAWVVDPLSDNSMLTGIIFDNELQTNMEDEDAEPEFLNSHDGDNGFFYFMPMKKDGVYGFYSLKIDVSKAANPVFEFWYQGKGSVLEALVGADGAEPTPAKAIDLKAAPTDGWTLCRIDLAEYKTARYIQIGVRLRAVHNDDETTWSVPLDNIRVIDLVDTDVRVAALSAGQKVKSGSSALVALSVENMGSKDCASVAAEIYKNGTIYAQKNIGSLAAGATASVQFAVAATALDDNMALSVAVVAENDMNPANNAAETNVAVEHPALPGIAALDGKDAGAGTVALSWTAPSLAGLTEPMAVFEDFENPAYPALTISDFGGWTMVDVDKKKTYSFLKDTRNPYSNLPMAFQLYDPVKAGVPDSYLIDATPHSGNTMLVAWSAQGLNDNWLVSPELSGKAQTVSFYAKSFSIAYPESFEVRYTTTDIDGEFFLVDVENYPEDGAVPEDWTEFKAALPEGAKHFAIRHTAYDTFALYIDDISFEAAPELAADTRLEGYNVYRDGVSLSSTPVEGTEFADTPAREGEYAYRVSAVYNNGESRASDPVVVALASSGIGNIDASAIIITGGDCICVEGAEGLCVWVAAVDGKTVYRTDSATASMCVTVPAGVYLVKAGERVSKVIVR